MRGLPKVWNIPPSVPFLPALADALLDGRLLPGGDPAGLRKATILLPTRRAALRLTELLAARSPGGAVILPAIRTLGDIDPDRLAAQGGEGVEDEDPATADLQQLAGPGALAFLNQPVVEPMARHLQMTRIVLTWGETIAPGLKLPNGESPAAPTRPREAADLAATLAGLMDSLEIEEVDPSRIGDLAADGFAAYWEIMLKFLAIATEWWPAALRELGALDPQTRRSRLIEAYRQRLESGVGDRAVIAAGSTGSVPATARLLRTIAGLPNGHVVLPGLDMHLDDASFAAVTDADRPHPGHPQFGLARLLSSIGIARRDVAALDPAGAENRPRDHLFSSLMRPAATAERWAGEDSWRGRGELDTALAGISLIRARDDREEALAIAIAMREALEQPGRRAALVTPDRTLARRVKAELARWNLEIADSAGVPLAESSAGRLARLIAETVARGLSPDLLAGLLHHPLCRLGLDGPALADAAAALEILVLRGPRPAAGTAGLSATLEARLAALADPDTRVNRIVRQTAGTHAQAARDLAAALAAALGPFEALRHADLRAFAQAHHAAFRALARGEDGTLAPEAAAMAAMLEEIAAAAPGDLSLEIEDYPGLLDALIAGRNVPDYTASHPRLQILGALEARLVDADLMILGGLNEGVWPGETVLDPFLDRASRKAVGLPAPERRIGLAAHDFVQGAAAGRIILSRAERSGGKPSLPSRWLQRMRTVIGEDHHDRLAGRGARHIAVARQIDMRQEPLVFPEPRPRPPVARRPRRISASRITTWIRDPYSLYAGGILRLEPLDPMGAAPGPAERGTFIHAALERFEREQLFGAGGDPLAHLLACGTAVLQPLATYPELTALWRRQFARIAAWYIDWREARIPHIAGSLIERHGVLEIAAPGGAYLLTAIADRIDIMRNGEIEILDYKTGMPPSGATVRSGLEPQLTIEAAMAREGVWDAGHKGRRIGALRYLRLSGAHPPGEDCLIAGERNTPFDPTEAAQLAFDGLRSLIDAYDRETQPYLVKPRVAFIQRYADYDHLSRHGEWSAMEDSGDEA